MGDPLIRRLDSPRSFVILIVLTIAGYLANYFPVPLFYNVDVLFGSLFALIILQVYGPVPGVIAAGIISTHTYFLWQHPYAIIIMTAEVLAVAIVLRYRPRAVVIADTAYWIVVGMPLVWVFYHVVMGVGVPSTYLIAAKQAINGIVNAVLACLIVTLIEHFTSWLAGGNRRRGIGIREALFLVMVTLVLVPAMVIMIVTARQEMTRVEDSVQQKLSITASAAEQTVRDWVVQNLLTLRTLADTLNITDPGERKLITQELGMIRQADVDFTAIAVLDDAGRPITMNPAELLAESAIDVVRDAVFGRLSQDVSVIVTDALVGDDVTSGEDAPVIALTVPVEREGRLRGAIIGLMSLDRLAELLVRLTTEWRISALVIDGNSRVIACTDPDVEPLAHFAFAEDASLTYVEDEMYLRMASVGPNVSIMERWQDSEYGIRGAVAEIADWELILRAPIAPYQDELNDRYRTLLLGMLVLVVATVAIASVLSRWLISGVAALSAVTVDLPEKVTRNERLSWPSSTIAEIDTLINSFRVTTSHLGESFSRLQATNDALLEAKQEAEAANRTKSQFLANISHDLRTPLNGILGYAQILKNDQHRDRALQDAVHIIEKSGNHLLNLINDILDVSRLEAHRLVLDERPFRLGACLADVGDMIALQARQKKLDFVQEISETLPASVLGDEKRLRQVLLNLLNNAVKFTDSGTVTLRAHEHDGAIRFEVEDTGSGIAEEQLEQIFSPFQQLERDAGNDEGTGLGLAIVERLVAMMGGSIQVESTVGQGSRFWFDVAFAPAERSLAGDSRRQTAGAPTESAPAAADALSPDQAALTWPPPATATALADAVDSGDIRAILTEAQRLQDAHPEHADFAAYVIGLARGFEMNQLRGLFGEHVEHPDET